MSETPGRFLGQEDPLEKGKATHSSILAWRIPWTYSQWGRKESDTTQQLSLIVCLCGEARKRHKGEEIDESDTTLWEAAINMRTKIK